MRLRISSERRAEDTRLQGGWIQEEADFVDMENGRMNIEVPEQQVPQFALRGESTNARTAARSDNGALIALIALVALVLIV
jgi:hypothetical protein